MTSLLGLLVIALAILGVLKRLDVRLVLFLAALALGLLAGQPHAVVQTFLATFSNEKFVIPICSAMAFAQVLRYTQCDQHLVHLLARPIEKARFLLVPGAVLVGVVVNIPIVSQTSTAVTIGAVLVPLLRAARLSPTTIGAVLLLGSSVGGELLNPGAPELQTVSQRLGIAPSECVGRVLPLLLVQVGVSLLLFWWLCARAEKQPAGGPLRAEDEKPPDFKLNVFKALVPLVPLVLLFLTGPPGNLIEVPRAWLVGPGDEKLANTRLIGLAMLVGTVVAALTDRRKALDTARVFFEGAGYAFASIVSLIVVAQAFGKGVELIGLDRVIKVLAERFPGLLQPLAAFVPWAFGIVSGSGMAATQSVYGFFVEPAESLGIDRVQLGAIVSLGAAAGRTMSPVSAVALMSATLSDSDVFTLVRRVALPLLAGLVAVLMVAPFVL
jgi:DcuC family C4-dicarboxylate transporter